MKKQFFLFFLIIAAIRLSGQQHFRFHDVSSQGITVKSSTSSRLSLHYSIQELEIAEIDNGEAKGQEIILKGSFGSFAAGLPNLPSENHYIAIPQGATVTVEVAEKGLKTLRNVDKFRRRLCPKQEQACLCLSCQARTDRRNRRCRPELP